MPYFQRNAYTFKKLTGPDLERAQRTLRITFRVKSACEEYMRSIEHQCATLPSYTKSNLLPTNNWRWPIVKVCHRLISVSDQSLIELIISQFILIETNGLLISQFELIETNEILNVLYITEIGFTADIHFLILDKTENKLGNT